MPALSKRWEKLTVAERRALAGEKALQECEAQGVPFAVDEDEQRRLGSWFAGAQ